MIAIRPIWFVDQLDTAAYDGEVAALLEIERQATQSDVVCARLAATVLDDASVDAVRSLREAARHDLEAGCEMVRSGYEKQAYSLWRSWLEQTVFAIYFIEAPIVRDAWKVVDQVELEKGPNFRLMLHQLLANSGEKHPFSIVYNERHARVLDALKMSNVPKAKRAIERCEKVLTTLSQGVHGTYQPRIPENYAECIKRLPKHSEILQATSDLIALFWILLLTAAIDLPAQTLLSLRDGVEDQDGLGGLEIDGAADILALAPTFKRALKV
jgi:hypothetical protein